MMIEQAPVWDVERPIYRQLVEEIIGRIINQTYPEGEMLPSVRKLATDFLVNPLTAARAYRELDEFTETRRGVGVMVKNGVRAILMKRERKKFLREEWPAIRERIGALDIDTDELFR